MKKLSLIYIFFLTIFSHHNYTKHFVFLSSPGSGKGTFSQYMVQKYNYVHIGTGDIHRWRNDHNLSTQNNIIQEIIIDKISKALENNQNFILDNVISSENSLNFWTNLFRKYKIADQVYFLVLQASDKTCINRMKNRLICRKCFHVSSTTKKEKKCEQCGNVLTIRSGDHNSKFLKKRFKKYHENIETLTREIHYPFKLIEISSEQPLEILYKKYDKLHNLK